LDEAVRRWWRSEKADGAKTGHLRLGDERSDQETDGKHR
jgi:hypothetical protein